MQTSVGITAKLAAILALAAAAAADPPAAAPGGGAGPASAAPASQPLFPAVAVDHPLEIRARLLSGGTFVGRVDRWDAESMHGTFGTRRWSELAAADLRRVFTQLMDRRNGAQWLAQAELLAASRDGAQWADDAFKQARVNGQSEDAIAAARIRAAATIRARTEQERAEAQRRLQQGGASSPPNAQPGRAVVPAPAPWPVLTRAEADEATAQARLAAHHALEITGIRGELVESQYFVFGGDLASADLQRLGRELDAACDRACSALGLPAGTDPFGGKALVIAVASEDAFKLAEAAIFNAKTAAGQRSALHTDGPRVRLAAWRGNDAPAFAAGLVRQATLGLLYRAFTAAPLPEWAAEGFADWVARGPGTGVGAASPIDRERRAAGLQFFRQGGQAVALMAATTADGTWPGPGAVGPAVGYLLVDLMIADRPQDFGPWVAAVKGGTPWEEALKTHYRTDSAHMAASAAAWYRTNDGAPSR